MLFLTKVQQNFLPIIRDTLIVLALIFIIMLAVYLVSIYFHSRKKRYIAQKKPTWQSMIKALLNGVKSPDKVHLSRRERKYFRDVLIAAFLKTNVSGKDKIKKLYERLEFFNEDIQQLENRLWWKKVQAVERLNDLELAETEESVFLLLRDKRSEVRFSALRMLASTGSKKLIGMLPEIFADNTRWTYRFLVNELFLAGIPAHNLKTLMTSPDRNLRKAAAILLGRPGHKEAIPMLENLVNDDVKDVRREAVHSLGRIGSVKAIPILKEKVNDTHLQVRAAVARSLGQLKDQNTLTLLEKLADDADFDVRYQAFSALIRFGESGKNVIQKYKVKYPEMAREFLAGAEQ